MAALPAGPGAVGLAALPAGGLGRKFRGRRVRVAAHFCIYVSICIGIYLFYLSVCLSAYLPVYLSVHLSVYLCIYLSICI